jgi:hypothetical protein
VLAASLRSQRHSACCDRISGLRNPININAFRGVLWLARSARGVWREPLNDPHPGNRLLAMLSPGDQDLSRRLLEVVELDARRILDAPRQPISHVYFVESGLVSVVGVTSKDRRIEVGMVGYEGMTGLDVVLGDDSSPNKTWGSALRISTAALRRIMRESESLTAIAALCARLPSPRPVKRRSPTGTASSTDGSPAGC